MFSFGNCHEKKQMQSSCSLNFFSSHESKAGFTFHAIYEDWYRIHTSLQIGWHACFIYYNTV